MYPNRLLVCSLQSMRIVRMLHNKSASSHQQRHCVTNFPSDFVLTQPALIIFRRHRSAKTAAVPAESIVTSDNVAAPVNYDTPTAASPEKSAKSKKAAAAQGEMVENNSLDQQTLPAATVAATSPPRLDHPVPDGAVMKTFSPKIQNLVNEISKLTLIEVSHLNELMKKTFNIPDQPLMPAGMLAAMPKTAASGDDEEADGAKKKVEQTAFTVKLTKFDDTKKIPLIKEIKNTIEGLNLVQAKKFVETAPQIVKADMTKEAAEKLKAALEAAGGTVVIE